MFTDLSDEQKTIIAEEFKAGTDMRIIARKYGISFHTVKRSCIFKLGDDFQEILERHNKARTPGKEKIKSNFLKIGKLLAEGKTFYNIANELSIPRESLVWWVKSNFGEEFYKRFVKPAPNKGGKK